MPRLPLALFLILSAASPALAGVHGVPVPRGSKQLSENHYRSSRTFRKTVKFVQRTLRRRSAPHEAIPVYRYRGVAIARFLSRGKGSKWSAIHVFQVKGKTQIYVVPGKESLDEPKKTR